MKTHAFLLESCSKADLQSKGSKELLGIAVASSYSKFENDENKKLPISLVVKRIRVKIALNVASKLVQMKLIT